MSRVVYLTTDQVVLINARFGGSVRERGTVDAATMRCAHSDSGTEFYPTLWDKAAAPWALATTQGFIDGNERTAWTAMETFLALNGEFLRTTVVDASSRSRTEPLSMNRWSTGSFSTGARRRAGKVRLGRPRTKLPTNTSRRTEV